jgi:hypothetical protein
MSEHSPLPWKFGKDYCETVLLDAEGWSVCKFGVEAAWDSISGKAPSEEDAAYIVECVNSHDALVERVKELEDKIAQIHSALDGADSSRAKCRDYNELAVSNGLALGRIALIVGHEYNEGRKSSEGA